MIVKGKIAYTMIVKGRIAYSMDNMNKNNVY